MTDLEIVNDSDVRNPLLSVSPNRRAELTALLDESNPVWLLDRQSDRNLVQARLGQPSEIRMGLKCSKRLQVHAYAAAVILSSIEKPKPDRDQLLAPVDQMLNWAVGVDLARWLSAGEVELPAGHVLSATEEFPNGLLSAISKENKITGMCLC